MAFYVVAAIGDGDFLDVHSGGLCLRAMLTMHRGYRPNRRHS